MTRVLMTADGVGGVWQYANDLAVALRPSGVEVIVARLGPGAPAAEPGVTVIDTGLPLEWMCDGPAPVLAAGQAIARLAGEVGADLLHLNTASLAASAAMPVPTLAVVHGCIGTWWHAARGTAPDAGYGWADELTRAGLLAVDAVAAPSAAYAAQVAQHHRLPAVPLTVHNGRRAAVLPDAAPSPGVLTVGRMWDEVKNVALLDQVAARLSVPLEAVGALAGPHGERVFPEHLVTPGVLDHDALAARLAAKPVFVSAARFEPFGLAVLEAAQAGCPLVLSGIATFRELWSGAALMVEGDDPAAYAAAIERVLGDPGLRQHLGEAARIRAQRYTPEAMAAATASIYAGLLGTQARVAA